MNDYNQYNFIPTAPINPQKGEERKKVKKVSNLIGAAFIVLWLVPDILNSLLSDIIKIFGPSPEINAYLADPAFIMILQTVFSLIMFTLPFLILPKGLGKRVSDFAYIKRPNGRLFFSFVLMGVGLSAVANLVTNKLAAIFDAFGIHFMLPDIAYPEGVFGFALSFIAIAVTPALVEEFATRGMVMGAARQFGEGFGLVTSAVFFALMHGNMVQIPFAFIMGLIIGFAVIKSGSLITGIAIHFFNNAISVCLTYVMESVQSVKVESVISLFYIVFCLIIFLLGLGLAQKGEEKVWSLKPSESLLSNGEKLKLFFLSPCMIAAVGLTVIDCISLMSIS